MIFTDAILIPRHLQSMLIYSKTFFQIFFHLTLLGRIWIRIRIVVSIFQVKTDYNQAIKQACLRKKLTTRPLLPFLEIKEVSLAIKHDVKNFPPILRFRF